MDNLIDRAWGLMGAGLNEREAAKVLMDSGVSPEQAYLACKAASILLDKSGF